MFYQKEGNDVGDIPINTQKYSKIASEIEKFIEAKKKRPKTAKGTVEKID